MVVNICWRDCCVDTINGRSYVASYREREGQLGASEWKTKSER
jgi:hypothetical protein